MASQLFTLASRLCQFNQGDRVSGDYLIGGWVGFSADLNVMEKSLDPAGNRIPSVYHVARRCTD
jgi:hypothetical protein